jgi:hypothetical protein
MTDRSAAPRSDGVQKLCASRPDLPGRIVVRPSHPEAINSLLAFQYDLDVPAEDGFVCRLANDMILDIRAEQFENRIRVVH